MGVIWTSRKRTRQPQQNTRLSAAYPRPAWVTLPTGGMFASGYPGGVRNLVKPTEVATSTDSNNTFTQGATPFGIAAVNASIGVGGLNADATKWEVTTDALCGATEITLLSSFWRRGATDESTQWLNFRTDYSHSMDVFASTATTLTFGADWAGAWNGASQQTVTIGDGLVTIIAVIRQDGARFFCNGVMTGTKAGSGFTVGSTPYAIKINSGARSPILFQEAWKSALSDAQALQLSRNPWGAFAPQRTARIYSFPTGATNYSVTATDALTLADSASNVASLGAAGSDALTLADSASNVAALSATATDALSLADSASNVAALSATASDALPLADTLNATASGDYTATGSDALTLADSAANAAALGATGTDALTLADAASNTAALGATAADALTLADTLNASASGDYVVTATDALSLSDSVVAAYAAICIATDALTLADATSAAMAGEYAATATDALTLADAASNAAALGVSISEALTLAALVSAMLTGNTALTGTRGGYGVQMQLAARRAQIQTGRRRN